MSCGKRCIGSSCWSRRTRSYAGPPPTCRSPICREKRFYPLVDELAADGIAVAVTCRVLKLARQPYYRWRANPPITEGELVEAYRANALFDAHHDDLEFGYRYLAEEGRDAGESMADRTARRICTDNKWWSMFGKKRGKNGKTRATGARRSRRARLHRR